MLFETIINKGAEPVKWLLVALIAYTLAMGVLSFVDTPEVSSVKAPSRTTADTAKKPAANVNWILAKHLFGEAGAAPEVVDNTPAIQTRLPLELQSVFVADEVNESAAIVAQRGKPGKLFAVGENLPGNAKLVDVLVDRIILLRAGVRETLMFPKNGTQFVADDLDDAANTADANGISNPAESGSSNEAQLTETGKDELIESYRDKLANDAQGTLDELGIEVVDNDNSGGYRVSDIAQNPLIRQTGLQSGDVILSVNGRPVGDIQQDQLELANIMAQGSARLEVKRGPRRFFITASLK